MNEILEELLNNPQIRDLCEENLKQRDCTLLDFSLPIKIENGDKFDSELEQILENYSLKFSEIPVFSKREGLKESVDQTIRSILNAIKFERSGRTADAIICIRQTLERFLNNKFIVSDIDNSYAFRGASVIPEFKDGHTNYEENLQYPLTFYRCRVTNREKLDREEMLNIPLNQRSLCASERFSIPGIPCLYLGVTSYCCWKEVERPPEFFCPLFD